MNIKMIAKFIPDNKIDNLIQAEKFGKDLSFLKRRIGALELPKLESGLGSQYLASKALTALINKSGISNQDIDYLVVVTQNPDNGGLPHTSALIHGEFGLNNDCCCYDISLGCSGYVYALSIVKAHMDVLDKKCGVLITADSYSKIIDNNDPKSSLLFGDASTASLITPDGNWTLKCPKLSTYGESAHSIINDNGIFYMDGRAVFNFVSKEVPKHIEKYLNEISLCKSKVDMFILHQGSEAILSSIRHKLSLDIEKMPSGIKHTGNTVSSSIPILLENYIDTSNIQKIIISGFGVGLSIATMLLERTK
jgi:3-oxoacyl-[acyl-carrier-protein] synthase-3